jgi:hypothetical protein
VGGAVQLSSAVPSVTVTTVTDWGLSNGTTYTYRIRAYRGSWISSDVESTPLTTSC